MKHSYYPNDPKKNKACVAFLRSRSRLARRIPAKVAYPCQGGPYDGQKLRLTPDSGSYQTGDVNRYNDPASPQLSTAWFRVGDHHGRYTHKQQYKCNDSGVLVWEVSSDD